MKKTIALLIAALMLVMLPAVPSAEENGTTVRVLLETQGEETLTITVKGTYSVGDTSFTDGTVTASVNNGTITLKHSEKGMLVSTTGTARIVRAEADKDEANLTLFNKGRKATLTYLGDLVFCYEDSVMKVINYVGMREYLYGVVSGEVTDSSNEQVLKT